ncbi:MAG: HTTM domain-containing protein, partial [Planctomycetales bacterium]
MQAVKEFWVGGFVAALGVIAGFSYGELFGPPQFVPSVLKDLSNFTLFMGFVGFIVGSTGMQIWKGGFSRWARQYFGIDPRSLAVIRIGLGAIVILDLWMRARDLTAHYTNEGILPLGLVNSKSILSLHVLSGEAWVQMMLFVTTALFAFLMLIGYRTRLMTVICWFLMMSLQCRNPQIASGGDTFLRVMLFWSMFLPLGARYSVDSALNLSFSKRRRRIADAATLALLIQLACVYGFSGALKTHPNWTTNGTAAYYALSLDMLTTPLAGYLLEFPKLLKASTFGVLYLERFAPLLIFFPWR